LQTDVSLSVVINLLTWGESHDGNLAVFCYVGERVITLV
jgi:hypothetical protein